MINYITRMSDNIKPIKPPPCPNSKENCITCGARLEFNECKYCGNKY